MRLRELLVESNYDEDRTDGELSPLSAGLKKTIDIIGLASILGRNFMQLGDNGKNAQQQLKRVGMQRDSLDAMLAKLSRSKGPTGSCKNEILEWIRANEYQTYVELQIRPLPRDPGTGKPTRQSASMASNDEGHLSPISSR